jgi:hypothetical protein
MKFKKKLTIKTKHNLEWQKNLTFLVGRAWINITNHSLIQDLTLKSEMLILNYVLWIYTPHFEVNHHQLLMPIQIV